MALGIMDWSLSALPRSSPRAVTTDCDQARVGLQAVLVHCLGKADWQVMVAHTMTK